MAVALLSAVTPLKPKPRKIVFSLQAKIQMSNPATTEISQTGLRYVSKEGGSPYQGVGGTGETISCIKCGKHKLRSRGVLRRYLNSLFFYCFDCKPQKKGAES